MRFDLKQVLRPSNKKAEIVTFLGPWLGEFGFELIYWQGFVRRYCLSHPDEYIIVIGHWGNSALYELADEYWHIQCDQHLEPNMYLPGFGRGYPLILELKELGLLDGRLALPEQIFELGWIEFGRPKFNQEFKVLRPGPSWIGRIDIKKPYAIFFLRSRSTSPEKNWTIDNWTVLAKKVLDLGFEVVFSGGRSESTPSGFLNARDLLPDISDLDWLDYQLALIRDAKFIVSGESGTGFLPGLCGKPGVIFGSVVERDRYLRRENIFSVPLTYIDSRNPAPEDMEQAIIGLKDEHF